MGQDPEQVGENLDKLNENLAKLEALTQRLVAAMSHKRHVPPNLQGPGNELYMKAAAAYMAEMMSNPARLMEHQVTYWSKSLRHWMETQQAIGKGTPPPETVASGRDRRFANPLWDTHPYFSYIKHQYLLNAQMVETAVGSLEGLDEQDRKRVSFFARQIVDMLSPANFLGTNPEALKRAVETEGASLVQGLENLVRDIEANDGDLLVTLSDPEAFEVGTNIATAEGAVVYRNRMFELIQFSPTTEQVHATPVVVFPPWINKFYILDLKAQNSLIRWIVDQGYTLFVVSWVNPDASYADVGLDTYVEEGFLTAIEQARAITGADKVNAVGYCIGGTTLALTLAVMAKRGLKTVRSATFLTTLTDFSDVGEMEVFLEDDFVDGIERECNEKGFLHSFFISRTFTYLRANDLVYAPAIRSYMLGEAPPAFDLLYWNGDGTNLPGRMTVEYLRDLCQSDRLAQGSMEILGETVGLKDIKLPLMMISCETDHIAEWKATYRGLGKMGSRDKTFVLSQSGHIAGIVNPPAKDKYGHYTSDAPLSTPPEDWRAQADFEPTSWWPLWEEWLRRRSGRKVPARAPGGPNHPVLEPAPGSYVKVRPAT